MAIATFSLPVDIPWRRLCVSDDMIDLAVCDRKFPYRWRSSIAVFGYQPPEDQQNYDDMTVSYLKVSCTITSFQPDPTEVGLTDRRPDSYWDTPLLIQDYADKVAAAYPCYGAVLEVAVAPSILTIDGRPVRPDEYPCFMDFDPKKREVYELVTQTGENMSRSLDDINVRKGTTTSDSHEKLDILNGISASGQTSVLGSGGGGSFSVQGQWGTRDINQKEASEVNTTDTAKENRETNSHTTQLTQMYQQLNSYHLGTNRAVFFVLPRPHIVDDPNTPLTFINGPRRLEGIQEFFLVVLRPKTIPDVCVEAYLETAHVGQVASYGPVTRRDTDTTPTLSLRRPADPVNPKHILSKAGAVAYTARPGWAIDTGTNGGYKINVLGQSGKVSCVVSEIDQNHLVLKGEIQSDVLVDRDPGTGDDGSGKRGPVNKPGKGTVEPVDGALDANATVYLQQGGQTQTGSALGLYITGRGVCCCAGHEDQAHDPRLFAESVVFEHMMEASANGPVGHGARMRAADANVLRDEIGRLMVKSVGSPDRYAPGAVSFAETQMVAQSVASLLRAPGHPDDHLLTDIRGLDPGVRDKVAARMPGASRGDLLAMSLAEQRDRFGLSQGEVGLLRRALIGLEGPPPPAEDRWNLPGQRGASQARVTVPLLMGLSSEASEAALTAAGLGLGDITVVDSPLPAASVAAQTPAAGTEVNQGGRVSLQLASGLSVRLPEISGVRLSEALCRLIDAGLRSEPIVAGKLGPDAHVAALEPPAGTLVTPETAVTVTLRSGAPGR